MNLRDDSDLTDDERLELADISDEELADDELISELIYGELSHRERAAALLRLCDDKAFRARARVDLELEMRLPAPRQSSIRKDVREALDMAIEEQREADRFENKRHRWRRSKEPPSPGLQKAWENLSKDIGFPRSDIATGDLLDDAGHPLPFQFWNNVHWRVRWARLLAVVSLAMKIVAIAAIVYAIARALGWAGVAGLP